ncbi:unnamed protein product [Nyctereutes procyonoides]|uniref:(raccoon dog) hypothetical protein n=1 Tax=Nyctereutes procyonoides TaxID=34880 RepID=A0A811YEU9_NYCPR|nr:unnamed protein product [Nyctereutes procyonoides]
MSGCSKRCKLGFVKFAQTIFKLITGTLSKERAPQGPALRTQWPLALLRPASLQLLAGLRNLQGTESSLDHLSHQTPGPRSLRAVDSQVWTRSPEFSINISSTIRDDVFLYREAFAKHIPSGSGCLPVQ